MMDVSISSSSIARSCFMNSIIYIVGLVVVVVAVLSFFGLR
jgi:small-conductance mechanosensitive channel